MCSTNRFLSTVVGLDKWDTTNLVCVSGMFGDCTKLTDLDFSGWNFVDENGNPNQLCKSFVGYPQQIA